MAFVNQGRATQSPNQTIAQNFGGQSLRLERRSAQILEVSSKQRKNLQVDASEFFHVSPLAKVKACFNKILFGGHNKASL